MGLVMLAATLVLVYRWKGLEAAWLATFVLMTMPKFWRYSHWILLDIAVGAFCSLAIVSFAIWRFWPPRTIPRQYLLYLLAFFSACAFLTKGTIAVFHVVVVVGAFCLAERRGEFFRSAFRPVVLGIFLLPVALWVFLFYRDGGLGYLHEHFVNNILGRFLHIPFALQEVRFNHTDLGNKESWSFYLEVFPEIMGPWLLFLPFALFEMAKEMRSGLGETGKVFLFLLIWAFVPPILLSIPAIKERSYILPSYTAYAVMVAYYLHKKLFDGQPLEGRVTKGVGLAAVGMIPVFAVLHFAFSGADPVPYLWVTLGLLSLTLPAAARLLFRKRFIEGLCLGIAILISVHIILYTPNVLYMTKKERCYLALAQVVSREVGDHPLYLYRPKDHVKGSIPFYRDRPVREIDRPEEVGGVLSEPGKKFLLLSETSLGEIRREGAWRQEYLTQFLPDVAPDVYVLVSNGN